MTETLARRSRLQRALVVLVLAAVVEFALWRFFLVSSYYEQLFLPLALLVALVFLLALWRALKPRASERRAADRRRAERRDGA